MSPILNLKAETSVAKLDKVTGIDTKLTHRQLFVLFMLKHLSITVEF